MKNARNWEYGTTILGWWYAQYTDKNGKKVKYELFYDDTEALTWLYGRLRGEYGAAEAEKQVGARLGHR